MKSPRRSPMTILFAVTFLFASVALLFLQAPRISGERVHDLGMIDLPNDRYRHTFRVRNLSLRPSKVSLVQTTCGCTVADVERTTVYPLQILEVPVEVNLEGKAGEFNVSTIVHFENGPPVDLTITGYIQNILPEILAFGHFSRESTVERSFTVDMLPSDFEVVVDSPAGAEFVITENETKGQSPTNGKTTVTIKTGAAMPFGSIDATATVVSSSGQHEIALTGYVMRPVEPAEQLFSFGQIENPQRAQSILFKTFGENAVRFLDANSPCGCLSFSESPGHANDSIAVDVSFRSIPNPGVFKEVVSFRFKSGDEVIEVPANVYGYVPFSTSN